MQKFSGTPFALGDGLRDCRNWKKLEKVAKSMKDSMQNPTLVILNLHIRNKAVRVQRTYTIENADFVCRGNTTVNLHRTL